MAIADNIGVVDVLLGCVGVYILKRIITSASSGRPKLPPGPKPKPLIGNLLDLPPPGQLDWLHWAKHKELYGPISSVTVLGKHIIILNELEDAVELLDRKSSIYSDRPVLVFGGIMCGWNNSLPLLRYGERFRKVRKNVHQVIGSNIAMRKFYGLEEVETRRFLLRLLKKPAALADHIRTLTGAIILSISHGYSIEPEKPDPLIELADDVLLEFSLSAQAGAWIVDVMPFLRYLPDWFPGTGFKRIAAKWFYNGSKLIEKPHAFVKQQMAAGTAAPSFTHEMLEKGPVSPEEEFIIKWSAAAIYGGGADTTVSAMYSFFLAMVLNPEVQKKAQEELDRVIGTDRLPTFEDRDNLPYVNAVLKETLRWNPIVPLGIPHVPMEDGVYKGYSVPKGALILANIYAYNNNPSTFHDPTTFKPERFLGVDGRAPEPDTHDITFGFGRRICPGKELADHSLFIAIAMSLAVFNIAKAKDSSGNIVEPRYEYTNGTISRPMEYDCTIMPRSEKAAALINNVVDEHPFQKSDAEALLNLKWELQENPFAVDF